MAAVAALLGLGACSTTDDSAHPLTLTGDDGGSTFDATRGDDGATGSDAAAIDTGASLDATRSDAADASDGGKTYVRLPCTTTIGTGTGTFDVPSTGGNDGDVICIKAGTYSGGTIKGVARRTLQNDGGQVKITGVVEVGNLTDVTLSGSGDDATPYGFQATGAQASFVLTGPNRGLIVHDVEAVGGGILFDAGHTGLVWNGNTTELVLYKTLFDRIHLKQSGQLFQGNYGAPSAYTNFVAEVEMSNVTVEDSKGVGQNVVAGGGMFGLNVHDWTITGPNDVVEGSGDDRDTGVFLIVGSGTFRRLHRDGGWGWLVRAFAAELGALPGEIHCEHNVDVNTEYYGTCEIRNEDSPSYLVPGKLSSVTIFVGDNLSARKKDLKGGYTTAIALIPNLGAGTTANLTNNVGCENVNDYGDKDSLHFFVVNGTVNQSGNQALSSCAGLVDPITHKPL